MVKDMIKTTKRVIPMIYAYTTPEIARHDGWTKIGYTEQAVDARLKQQTKTADVKYHEEWRGNAVYEDGSGETFKDVDFHAYLRKAGIENQKSTEWFHVNGLNSRTMFFDFKSNRGILSDIHPVMPYTLRNEQQEAVLQTMIYKEEHPDNGEFLWNAKPRFGKTLSVYDFAKQIDAKKVLIVTNRPAIANSWYSDYERFLGTESGYYFVSNTQSLQGKPLVITREKYVETFILSADDDEESKFFEFVSLQDLKGSIYFGGQYKKLGEVKDLVWDLLVIDEAHEGVDTYKTDAAFDRIKRNFTLHLSGTPFKALANDKFSDSAIFNWTYADEQAAKRDWASEENNPYETLPRLNLFTYQMSEIIRDEIEQGIEINGETEEFAFDLNEFFKTSNGKFVHDSAVNKFLDSLTTQTKYPFSTPELRDELKHTFWLLNRVDSATALAKKLETHPVFKDYKVILAAGDGKLDDSDETQKSFDAVIKAIQNHDKTITLSVGQLTTGVTIPEWTAVLMLSNIKSPSLYMQAAFRAQNPCLFSTGSEFYRKENAYVFDFDPARTLVIFEEFANDLSPDTTNGKGDTETRKKNVRELLNFFPVIGEDDSGEMIKLDAEKVLSIPRKIRSQEVVRRGFMSDFLFQNISNVFHAPTEVINIISNFTPVAEPKAKGKIETVLGDGATVNESGEVMISEEHVIGQTTDLFGDKIYDVIAENMEEAISEVQEIAKTDEDRAVEKFESDLKNKAIATVIDHATEVYGKDMTPSDKKQVERSLKNKAERKVRQVFGDYKIEKNTLEQERKDALLNRIADGRSAEDINREFDERQKDLAQRLQKSLTATNSEFCEEATRELVKTVETNKNARKKDSVENTVKDHLRGFSRTIPSFLMAYGDDTVTLSTFDKVIPDVVFQEVTSISLEQFRFLRDGGSYVDELTGEERKFEGHLFEPVVFDDSVKEFMKKRRTLANYFDEQSKEDIFDYIPPQKTNQIFTPKQVVKMMVDMLEENNPGCFDKPDKTFIDLYMKSGLYITEIVKRLYQSAELKRLFPKSEDRLKHIFEKQVYGLAPTEIIYKIATNFILGFDDTTNITKHNFRQVDALPYAKEGTLEEMLEEIFGE